CAGGPFFLPMDYW
nr:immunoglobulin heavy chain junction region [Macaca mulatta]MOW98944.1 immunoglobulin heavy chain junction region [Macaca mulatta]MOW98945.1 immunoglobulin heavy chain junction region [Macaca mulatta]MOW99611.1 immunoglobulin heavy chain junction region [Macaca mulatta]MOW99625.1 immunoglobulin heavy chain junction region [Macaca mulatta]